MQSGAPATRKALRRDTAQPILPPKGENPNQGLAANQSARPLRRSHQSSVGIHTQHERRNHSWRVVILNDPSSTTASAVAVERVVRSRFSATLERTAGRPLDAALLGHTFSGVCDLSNVHITMKFVL